mmetsp:Transcript_4420/g.15362  ORF Transcript_4420/g.15362 Transcript_4420/m.15362 type:complete len:362 (-) Transcript_4420:58-1143(-)
MVAVKRGSTVAVTGATGFIGSHIVKILLERGYTVRAVVRSLKDEARLQFLKDMVKGTKGKLELTAGGDLLAEGAFDAAFSGAEAVIHTAAIVEILNKSDPVKNIINPSTKGTANILRSVEKATSVKRYVHTSSCIAVQSMEKPEDHIFTEKDWNEYSSIATGDAYGYAKTQAEKQVLEFFKEGKQTDCAFVLPGVCLGPVFTKQHTKASTVLVREMLYGNPMLNYYASFVDVRDVARAHVDALETAEASGQRYLVTGGQPAMRATALGAIAKAAVPEYRMKASPKHPMWLVTIMRILSLIPLLGSLIGLSAFDYAVMTKKSHFDCSKVKKELRMVFTPLESTIKDSAVSMVEGGFVKAKKA